MVTPEQYNNVFNVSPSGRAILEDMMNAHSFHNTTFSVDPYTMAFKEGERNVVLRILTILDTYKKEVEENA